MKSWAVTQPPHVDWMQWCLMKWDLEVYCEGPKHVCLGTPRGSTASYSLHTPGRGLIFIIPASSSVFLEFLFGSLVPSFGPQDFVSLLHSPPKSSSIEDIKFSGLLRALCAAAMVTKDDIEMSDSEDLQ